MFVPRLISAIPTTMGIRTITVRLILATMCVRDLNGTHFH